jgi:hypothetical protein
MACDAAALPLAPIITRSARRLSARATPSFTGRLGTKKSVPIFTEMEYRGIEYTVVQGIGRQVWKWSVSLDNRVPIRGQAAIKSEAVAEAERAIDRALAPKKLRLVQPKTE